MGKLPLELLRLFLDLEWMDSYFLYSHVVPPPLPAGPAFGGEGRIRSLLTQARATRMNLTSLLLVNLELA